VLDELPAGEAARVHRGVHGGDGGLLELEGLRGGAGREGEQRGERERGAEDRSKRSHVGQTSGSLGPPAMRSLGTRPVLVG
jgi:hypothetical protein